MLVHNIIKITYVREGYLPNYPYHMISDKEMFDAFLHLEEDGVTSAGYFVDRYPCADESLQSEYDDLVEAIRYHITSYLESDNGSYVIPDWVYSYMLGVVVSESSDVLDKHDLFVLLNLDNLTDTWTKEISESCLELSEEWVKKLPPSKTDHRPPTIFGEPHVIKSLRLKNVDVL